MENKMKRWFIALTALIALGFVSSARAEMSAGAYSGKSVREQQVFADVYNNFGDTITENYVVILDTSTAVLASTGTTFGAYVTVDPGYASDNVYVMGVADEYIPTGSVGRICVRGPHKVYATAGYIMGNGTAYLGGGAMIPRAGVTAGTSCGATGQATVYSKADATIGGKLGTFLASDNVLASVWWIWIDPRAHN
jgi:hypothetical protein